MKKILVLLVLGAMVAGAAFAQTSTVNHPVTLTINAIAMIGLNDATNITLTTVNPATAGDPPTGQTNNSKYLRYTTINDTGLKRTVTVQWDSGDADRPPTGTELHVVAGASAATGAGTPATERTIGDAAQTVLTAIGSCITGTAAASGHQLTYSFVIVTPSDLVSGTSNQVTVLYTLNEDA